MPSTQASRQVSPRGGSGPVKSVGGFVQEACVVQVLTSSAMSVRYQTWDATLPHGLPLCALCIGNDDYEGPHEKLDACVKDARKVSELVHEKLGSDGATATLVCNLKTKEDMKDALKKFLSKICRPPRMVIVYFSGHGQQEDDTIFIVPTRAKPSNKKELRDQCLSHDNVFRILKKDLEDRCFSYRGAGTCVATLYTFRTFCLCSTNIF